MFMKAINNTFNSSAFNSLNKFQERLIATYFCLYKYIIIYKSYNIRKMTRVSAAASCGVIN